MPVLALCSAPRGSLAAGAFIRSRCPWSPCTSRRCLAQRRLSAFTYPHRSI